MKKISKVATAGVLLFALANPLGAFAENTVEKISATSNNKETQDITVQAKEVNGEIVFEVTAGKDTYDTVIYAIINGQKFTYNLGNLKKGQVSKIVQPDVSVNKKDATISKESKTEKSLPNTSVVRELVEKTVAYNTELNGNVIEAKVVYKVYDLVEKNSNTVEGKKSITENKVEGGAIVKPEVLEIPELKESLGGAIVSPEIQPELPKAEVPTEVTPKTEEPAAGTTPKAEEPAAGTTPKAEEPAAGITPKAEEPAAGTTPKAEEPAATTTPKADESASTTPKAEESAAATPKAEESAAATTPKAEEPAAGTTPKAEEPAATTPNVEESASTTPKAEESTTTTPKADESVTTPKADESAATTPKAGESAATTPKADESETTTPKAEEPAAVTTPKAEEPAATTPKADESETTTPKAEESAATTPKTDESAVTTPKADESATTPKTDESAVTTPKADESATTTPKAEESTTATPKADESATKENLEALDSHKENKLSEIKGSSLSDEDKKAAIEKVNKFTEKATKELEKASSSEEQAKVIDKYEEDLRTIDVPNVEYPKTDFNRPVESHTGGTTIDANSTVANSALTSNNSSSQSSSTGGPTQPTTEERSTSTGATQPTSTSEGTSGFRNAPEVQVRAKKVVKRDLSNKTKQINIYYNLTALKDIAGALGEVGENNMLTLSGNATKEDIKKAIEEHTKSQIDKLNKQGFKVTSTTDLDQIIEGSDSYDYVVEFTKEAKIQSAGNTGFRKAPATQRRAKRSTEAQENVNVNIYFNLKTLPGIAGALDVDGDTTIKLPKNATVEQVKAAIQTKIAKVKKRGYKVNDAYFGARTEQGYDFVVEFTK